MPFPTLDPLLTGFFFYSPRGRCLRDRLETAPRVTLQHRTRFGAGQVAVNRRSVLSTALPFSRELSAGV